MSEVIVRMGKIPERCVDCAIRLRCAPYLMALYKTEDVYELESLVPKIGSKDCAIVCVLPEQHGRLGDLDSLAKMVDCARIDAMQEGSDTNPYWLLCDIIAQAKTIVPATERSNIGKD